MKEKSSPKEHPFFEFRGHEIGIGDLPSAIIHLYRAQIGRADIWRQRLDSSTNWAVVTTAAALTVTFTEPDTSQPVIPLCSLLITMFWTIESRRYRYFELWSYRVALLEDAYFSRLLAPTPQTHEMWSIRLADSLRNPQFTITKAEALGRRFRRIYFWLYTVLGISWMVQVWIYPSPINSISMLSNRLALGSVPTYVMLVIGLVSYLALITFGLSTWKMRDARGEVLRISPKEPNGSPSTSSVITVNVDEEPS